jgi:hypothetical protein
VNYIWVATLKHVTHGPPLVLYLGCHSSNSVSISVSALLLHLSELIYLSSCSCSPPFSCYCHLWSSYLNHEVLSFHQSSSSVPDPIMVQHYHHFWWTPEGKFKSWPNAHINIGGSEHKRIIVVFSSSIFSSSCSQSVTRMARQHLLQARGSPSFCCWPSLSHPKIPNFRMWLKFKTFYQ